MAWCLHGDRAAEYWIDNTARICGGCAESRAGSVDGAVKELERAGCVRERVGGERRVKGIYSWDMMLRAGPAERQVLDRAEKVDFSGIKLRFAKREDVIEEKVGRWRDAGRPAEARERDLMMIRRMTAEDEGLRKGLPEEVRRAMK